MAGGWSVVPSPNVGPPNTTFNDLLQVSCVPARACTAVGYYMNDSTSQPDPRNMAQSWNGAKWSLVPVPDRGQADGQDVLFGVSCLSARACTAVGYYTKSYTSAPRTLIESWNGTRWSVVPSPDTGPAWYENALGGVSCLSARACTAVGWYSTKAGPDKTLAESWNGARWSLVPTPSPGVTSVLRRVSCVSARLCVAVGGYSVHAAPGRLAAKTLAESWNGTAWSVMRTPNPHTDGGLDQFQDVSCVPARACTAVGYYSINGATKTLAESWNGTAWSVAATPNPPSTLQEDYLLGVSCVSARACTATGYYIGKGSREGVDKTLAESWDGIRWSALATPNADAPHHGNALNAVSCVSARTCTAVGSYGPGRVARTLIESS